MVYAIYFLPSVLLLGTESGPDQDMVSQMLEEALGSDEQSVTKDRSKLVEIIIF